MAELPDRDKLLRNFGRCANWEEKYLYIIELGQRLPPLHLKGRTVYTGQKRPVKGPRPRRGVRPLQPTVNRLIRREKGAAPSQPQGGFYQEQRIFLVCRRHSLIPVQAQGQMLAAPGPGHRHGDPAVRRGLVAPHKVSNGPELSPHR